MKPSKKFLRLPSVIDKVGLSRSQIYKLIQQGDFPEPVKIGPKISVWIEEKLEMWMDAQVPQ
jgi:prophage regulatory protein